MKFKLLLTFILCFFTLMIHAQPSLDWAKNIGTAQNDNGRSIEIDNQDNIYSCSVIQEGHYVFLFKQNSLGDTIWSATFGNPGSLVYVGDLEIDAYGNAFLIGSFGGTISFSTPSGPYLVPSLAYNDIYIVKFNSAGIFQWVRVISGNNYDGGSGITCDPLGNLYLTGTFRGSVNYDTYQGTQTHYAVSNGTADFFVCKMDSIGVVTWFKRFGGVGQDNVGKIKIAPDNKLIFSGSFNGSFDFDPGFGIYYVSGNFQGFISRFDTAGNFIDLKLIGGNVDAFDLDSKGNIYLVGDFFTSGDFDPGPGTYMLNAGGSLPFAGYICKWDANCAFKWAYKVGGPYEQFSTVTIDSHDNFYFGGQLTNSTDFNPGPGTFTLFSSGEEDGFICKLDSNANFLYAFKIGATYHDRVDQLVVSNSGKILVIGTFNSQIYMDPVTQNTLLVSMGGSDVFIAQYNDPLASGIESNLNQNVDLRIFPNPSRGTFSIMTEPEFSLKDVKIINALGELVYYNQQASSNSTEFNLPHAKPGLYWIRIIGKDKDHIGKIVLME